MKAVNKSLKTVQGGVRGSIVGSMNIVKGAGKTVKGAFRSSDEPKRQQEGVLIDDNGVDGVDDMLAKVRRDEDGSIHQNSKKRSGDVSVSSASRAQTVTSGRNTAQIRIEEDASRVTRSSQSMHGPISRNAQHVEKSAGTQRLERILQTQGPSKAKSTFTSHNSTSQSKVEKVQDPNDAQQVGQFAAAKVIPPLQVDSSSIGGAFLEKYPSNMVQECIACLECQQFDSTQADLVQLSALEYPEEYAQLKRGLGILTGKARNKRRYVLICRSTNRPLVESSLRRDEEPTVTQASLQQERTGPQEDDYDAMFGQEEENADPTLTNTNTATTSMKDSTMTQGIPEDEMDEISSFPVLVCLTLHADGSGPDVRKLVPLDQLTTVQDLHTTVVQLAFSSGDTIRIDFSGSLADEEKISQASLDKERFIWSLMQIHAILCTFVVERNAMMMSGQDRPRILPTLNVRNVDRAELQYVATVNSFLGKSEELKALLDRQRALFDEKQTEETKSPEVDLEGIDSMAYDLLMGNYSTRVSLFQSEEERNDAEEILNMPEWVEMLNNQETAALNVAEQLGDMLQGKMRDLEAETCRRLIAWEDEKQDAGSGGARLFDETDTRDTVDALALASLFKMLESLDTELSAMEDWLQERAAAIKPLTDDCADIEEENRQLEQQWKSYEQLGQEMRRLLKGLDLDEDMERTLKDPASALVYDDDGLIDEDASEEGVERIYLAGKSLQEALEYPRQSGGLHLLSVSERADGLYAIAKIFCKSLAHVLAAVMEQFKNEVVAGSDNGKVSKSDTHITINKKIKDTQRKFQGSLLSYMKLLEVLAALAPDMLPALREAYAEMVQEGILMKKRCKGYFQALPGKNSAFLTRSGKELSEYQPFVDAAAPLTTVNAPDIRYSLSEMLPILAREAYFVSALFGSATKDQDGREKKRNFESARIAVDEASQHFRYYVYRTCGIQESEGGDEAAGKKDPDALLCLVASICLHEAMDQFIDRDKKGGDHSLSLAYVRATILDLRKRADKHWIQWVDRQTEWIKLHEGVPLSGKRAGVFPSFSRFFCYIDHVIKCCREDKDPTYFPDLKNIKVVSYYMQKLANALIDSLRECADRETTDRTYGSYVMLMENAFFFTQSVKQRGDELGELFTKQVAKANAICKENTDSYLGWMIKREFTALHELFSKISKIRKELGDKEVSNQVPKSEFTRILRKEASREILREKITALFARMEKHIAEESGLLPVAWKALVKVLFEWFGRWEKLSTQIYRHKLDPGAVDIVKIAKAAGGAAKDVVNTSSDFGFRNMLTLSSTKK